LKTILTIENLTKKFGRLTAVSNLSFSIEKGNVYGILGPNGSGKSTTLGVVLNVVNKTSGSFSWFGGDVSTHNALKKVGAIIERPNFYPYMSAKQNLELVCKIKGVSKTQVQKTLDIVGLLDRQNDAFKSFSLGMKQRLAIASALLNNPEILILDEPTNGLDPQGIHQIRGIIKKIAAKGTTILLASHLLDEVEKVCTHVVVLSKGKSLYVGSVEHMNASFGFVTLQCNDMPRLKKILEESSSFENIKEDTAFLVANLTQEMDAAKLNAFLFEKGITLSHLVQRKESLEEKFLALTQNPAKTNN
jgi:ABC-2 type transport system ATP-binding protein